MMPTWIGIIGIKLMVAGGSNLYYIVLGVFFPYFIYMLGICGMSIATTTCEKRLRLNLFVIYTLFYFATHFINMEIGLRYLLTFIYSASLYGLGLLLWTFSKTSQPHKLIEVISDKSTDYIL
jgi:hypothetical protein